MQQTLRGYICLLVYNNVILYNWAVVMLVAGLVYVTGGVSLPDNFSDEIRKKKSFCIIFFHISVPKWVKRGRDILIHILQNKQYIVTLNKNILQSIRFVKLQKKF